MAVAGGAALASLTGEETLELRRQLLGAGQRDVVAEQPRPLVAAHEGVVLLLQGRDHVRGFLRLRDLLVDLRADAQPGSAQFVHREHQSGRAPDGFQQRQGGRRVVVLRQVVGDEHGEAHRIGAGLTQPVLQQVPGAAGHLDPLEPGLIAADQLPA